MANLKQDLDNYMLLNEERKSSNYKMPSFSVKMPKIPFVNSSESSTSNSWLNDQQEESSCCPKLNRLQRIAASIICIGLGCFCLVLSTFYIPVLVFKARKFALLFTLASCLFIIGFAVLVGFKSLMSSMFSRQKLAASISYTLCLILTLYFSMFMQSTALTVLFAVLQIISLSFMLFGVAPKGTGSSFKLFGSLFKHQASSSLPI